ncbi:pimeloyl-ACP methyl ester carboxylesterase [Amycolatopsis lexingtonensis]|uniref:Pimeloyl-ACP methyl ester carboxylesterase n=1 Tax=Amycolatopsis lexingtonensis TaxID=218822 RepID=A0ABR9HSM6_9PSEU|nr:alpha/beta fold hydrolase [Amycolatopsis lexingtonensis]MBE1493931.1 pimeloyl-ACP methyl ester carboxylesterase [Amycolatopsis lexingtonensis]
MTAELAFERFPGGPASFSFVLVHGWARSRADWAPVLEGLCAIAPVVAVDLPGHGASPPGGGMRLPQVAADVHAVIERLGLARVVLVGHSAGSEVAAFLARREPELVAGLVVVDPAFGLPDDDRARVEAMAGRLRTEDPVTVAAEHFARSGPSPLPGRPVSATPEAIRELFTEFAFAPEALHFRTQTAAFFAGFPVPVLAFYRNEDRARLAREVLPAADIRVLPGGHWTHHEHPAEVVSAIAGWTH